MQKTPMVNSNKYKNIHTPIIHIYMYVYKTTMIYSGGSVGIVYNLVMATANCGAAGGYTQEKEITL